MARTAKNKIGGVSIKKGKTEDGIPVVMWDAVPKCDPSTCKMEEVCPHPKAGKCGVRVQYLTHVFETLIGQVDPDDSMAMFQIGFHLVPLYQHLVQFKMEEFGSRVMYAQDNGRRYINPVFKEIRETIKIISQVLRDIRGSLDDDKLRDMITDGDGEYYDRLFTNDGVISTRKRNRV